MGLRGFSEKWGPLKLSFVRDRRDTGHGLSHALHPIQRSLRRLPSQNFKLRAAPMIHPELTAAHPETSPELARRLAHLPKNTDSAAGANVACVPSHIV
jgi:hypothetical protein